MADKFWDHVGSNVRRAIACRDIRPSGIACTQVYSNGHPDESSIECGACGRFLIVCTCSAKPGGMFCHHSVAPTCPRLLNTDKT